MAPSPAEIKMRLEQNWLRLMSEYASKFSSERIQGSSPPSVFVGRYGYPKVRVGPLLPPISGDTWLLDSPERWTGRSFEEIAAFRVSLIRGTYEVKVTEPSGKYIETLQELAMSRRPADSEVLLTKRPAVYLESDPSGSNLNSAAAPFGPSAPLKRLTVSSASADSRIESAFYDGDLNANGAVAHMYEKGIEVSRISRAISMGMIGIHKKRRLVPTRWAITATDDIISKMLVSGIQHNPSIDSYQVASYSHLENVYSVILIPSDTWSFELIESWFTPEGELATSSDYESANGLNHYPATAGAYFAARLAVAEYLRRIKRKSAAIVLRDIRPGYVMPMGVWQIREGVRQALRNNAGQFESFEHSISNAILHHSSSAKELVHTSMTFRELRNQTRISSYFG